MVQTIVPVALFVCIAYMVVALTRIISEGRTHRKLLEKGATPEQIVALTARPKRVDLAETLRWALLTGAVGISLIVLQFIPYDSDQPIAVGLVLVFGSAGLLAYYAAARRLHAE